MPEWDGHRLAAHRRSGLAGFDLLTRSMLALGASKKDIARALVQ
jgi:hypothetical protein